MNKLYELIDSIWHLISKTIFVRFVFDLPAEELIALKKKGRLIFACTSGGLVEWLILSSWCRTQGMGAILVANRKRILMFAKPLYFLQIIFRTRRYSDFYLSKEEGPRIIFCSNHERKKLFDASPVEVLLSEILIKEATYPEPKPSTIIPVFICWKKDIRGQSRKPSEYLFGLSSNPNWIGKIWYLIRKRNDSTVRSLDVLILGNKDFKESSDPLEESEPMKIARFTRRKILVTVNQEMRVVLGPRYFSPHSVKETLMRDPEIQAAIEERCLKMGTNKKIVMMQTYQYLTEIVANYSYRFIEVMYAILIWIFTKVFDGIVTKPEDFQRIRETMKTKPIVFVSCHRSHLDYLVIPYLMFSEDMITPHIVAGLNLAFWPAGHFLRQGGAFFIRRSFKGNPLYAICLRKYIETLLKNRINIKFFIEGTRSRSGKILPPTYGILKMILESHQHKAVEDIALIPVSIVYDQVLEQKSYTTELTGGKKEKESTKGLIKSRKLINKKIGKVYVNFGEVISTKEIFNNAEENSTDFTLMLQKTAFQLSKTINDISPVTPKSLVCSVLLASRETAESFEKILGYSLALADYVTNSKNKLSVQNDSELRFAIELTLRRLYKEGDIISNDEVPKSYYCEESKRTALNFYKNNALHCLVTPALSLMSILSVLEFPENNFRGNFQNTVLELRNIFKFEFFFSPTPVFINEVNETMNYFIADWSEIDSTDNLYQAVQSRFEDLNLISIFVGVVGELLESYYSMGVYLKTIAGQSIEQKLMISKFIKNQKSDSDLGLYYPESISNQNYSNSLMFFENLNVVKIEKKTEGTWLEVKNFSDEADHVLSRINYFLNLIQKN